MKIIGTIAFIFCASFLWAQEIEEDSISQTEVEKFQIYLSTSFRGQQFVETVASFGYISAGIRFNDSIDLSIYYGVILNNYKKQIIFPTLFYYEQENIGLEFQYEFTDYKIRPLLGLGINYSQLAWKSEGDLNDVFTDNIFIYSGFVGGIWSINKAIALQGNLGYAWPGEVEIVGLETEGFQGWNYSIAIKIGVFSF